MNPVANMSLQNGFSHNYFSALYQSNNGKVNVAEGMQFGYFANTFTLCTIFNL